MTVKFNMNQTVRVKLTDFGKDVLRTNFEEKISTYPHIYAGLKFELPQEDSNGWSNWQLWKLMETFGEYMYMGSLEIPFEFNIEILENS